MIKLSNLPNLLSFCNLLSGLGAITACTQQEFKIAAGFMLGSVLFDFFDGRLARKLNLVSEFGKELDSLCDIVSFIITPVVFALSLGYNQFIDILVYGIFMVAGATRLARYNIKGLENGNYSGVPVPLSSLIILFYFIFTYFNIDMTVWIILFATHAVLMVAPVKIPKI